MRRPSYWLGLLCLMPYLGAFIGVWLILKAIYTYNDKKLVAIGACGVIFSLGLYVFINRRDVVFSDYPSIFYADPDICLVCDKTK